MLQTEVNHGTATEICRNKNEDIITRFPAIHLTMAVNKLLQGTLCHKLVTW